MNNSIVFDKSQFTMHFTIDNRFQCSETFSREAYKSIPGAWAMAQSLARMGANPHQIRTAVLNIVKTFYEVKIFKTAPVVQKPARKETPVRTSASEASRHRTEDDGGGEDSDEDPARTRYLQRSRVLSLLLEGEALTQPKALEYKIWRLAARCCELTKRGFNIQKRRLPGNFTEYSIDPNNPYSIDPQSTLPFEGSADR